MGYASEHLRQQRYAFSEQEVKQYFPEDKVLAGHVQGGGDIVRLERSPVANAPVARCSALFRYPRYGRQAGWPVLSRPVCAQQQARRGMDGRLPSRAGAHVRHPDAGGLSQLQLRRAGGRASPRCLRTTKSSPCSTNSATACTICSRGGRPRRIRHQRRGVGCGGVAQPVHGELLLGMGCVAGS